MREVVPLDVSKNFRVPSKSKSCHVIEIPGVSVDVGFQNFMQFSWVFPRNQDLKTLVCTMTSALENLSHSSLED